MRMRRRRKRPRTSLTSWARLTPSTVRRHVGLQGRVAAAVLIATLLAATDPTAHSKRILLLVSASSSSSSSSPASPSPSTNVNSLNNDDAPLSEYQQYEISQALAKRDPLGAADDGDETTSSSSITLPTSMGESALIDRESGRIFWQGGPGVLFLSSSSTLQSLGAKHVRATTMTFILALALLSSMAARLRWALETRDAFGPWWRAANMFAKLTGKSKCAKNGSLRLFAYIYSMCCDGSTKMSFRHLHSWPSSRRGASSPSRSCGCDGRR
jgi:hypothetical protein